MSKLLLVFILFLFCYAQKEVPKVVDKATICWNNEIAADKYLVYQRNISTAQEQWELLGITTTNEFEIIRPSYDRFELGVRAVYGPDTSAIHSSLDSTACEDMEDCGACNVAGGWYIYWIDGKPAFIRLLK